MSELGLFFIIAAWIIQYFSISKKDKKISKTFVTTYALGVLFLVLDGFKNDFFNLAILNLFSFIATGSVWYRLRK